jgi:thioredoxin reductase/CxxC motif-containing protein
MKNGECDVLVIGAGPAGLAAAIGAREAGARRVILIDREVLPGGILQQCIHPGFGLKIFNQDLAGPEYAHRYISQLTGSGVELMLDTAVLEVDRQRRAVVTGAGAGIRRIRAGSIVCAMGCRERTRAQSFVPGFRPAGVLTAGTAQRFINIDGLMVGKKIVIVGSGDIGLIMARRCTLEGAKVAAVIEKLPFPGGLNRNVQQCVRDYQIPLHLGHRLTFIEGRKRVSGVKFRSVGGDGAERHLECDTVLFSVGLIPETELMRRVGIQRDERTGGPVVDNSMSTTAEGFFACGNLVQVYDLVDWVSMDGFRAGWNAALGAQGRCGANGEQVIVEPGENVRSVVPQLFRRLNGDGDFTDLLYVRVNRFFRNPSFVLRNRKEAIGTIRKPYAAPSEMIQLNLSGFMQAVYEGGALRIDVEEREPAGKAAGKPAGEPARYGTTAAPARAVARNGAYGTLPAGIEVTCVVCPNSCRVFVHQEGGELRTSGAECSRGVEYALIEATDPRRIFTSTVKVADGVIGVLSVRSTGPIRKGEWERAAAVAGSVEVRAPVTCRQVVVKDFLEQGIDLVATKDVDRRINQYKGGIVG